MRDLEVFEHPDVPLGHVWWRKQYRVALVHPQHDGIVYVASNPVGWHEPAICTCCDARRGRPHADWCATLAIA